MPDQEPIGQVAGPKALKDLPKPPRGPARIVVGEARRRRRERAKAPDTAEHGQGKAPDERQEGMAEPPLNPPQAVTKTGDAPSAQVADDVAQSLEMARRVVKVRLAAADLTAAESVAALLEDVGSRAEAELRAEIRAETSRLRASLRESSGLSPAAQRMVRLRSLARIREFATQLDELYAAELPRTARGPLLDPSGEVLAPASSTETPPAVSLIFEHATLRALLAREVHERALLVRELFEEEASPALRDLAVNLERLGKALLEPDYPQASERLTKP